MVHTFKYKNMHNLVLSPIDPEELIQSISDRVTANILKAGNFNEPQSNQPFIKGIHELSKFLRCSPSRAQKLKNEGRFPFFQDGRTLLFDPEQVRRAMQIDDEKKG